MKTTLTLSALVAACLLAAPVTAKEWKTVRFGVEGAYPPFSWTDASGEIVSIHRNSIDTGKMRRSSLDPTFLLA
nr:hypothetical protein [Aeromonas sp. PrichA-15]